MVEECQGDGAASDCDYFLGISLRWDGMWATGLGQMCRFEQLRAGPFFSFLHCDIPVVVCFGPHVILFSAGRSYLIWDVLKKMPNLEWFNSCLKYTSYMQVPTNDCLYLTIKP